METTKQERYIQFKNIGREKYSGKKLLQPEIQTPDEIAEIAYDEARHHLMSCDVQAVYDAEKNEGSIFAGLHLVGKFHLTT